MSDPTPNYRTISQLLKERSFTIDEYQREYKWEQKQIEELIDDLRNKFMGSYHEGDPTTKTKDYQGYFLGSIIVTERNALVDGQQRLTSLTLLLIYLFHEAARQRLPVADTMRSLIYADINGAYQFNVQVPERLPIIEALYRDEDYSVSGKSESIQNIDARYKDIKASNLAEELNSGLAHFIYWLMGRVGVIEIVTDTESDAYEIFETMNDRGKPLNPVDMLKAYFLGPITDEEQRQEANRAWKQIIQRIRSAGAEVDPERDSVIIKAWMRAQYAQSTRERKAGAVDEDWELLGSAFHRWARDHQSKLGWGSEKSNIRVIHSELPFFANVSLQIMSASSRFTPGLEPIYYNAHNEFTLQNTVLLAPLTVNDDEETVRRKLAATATYLDIWLIRRVVNYTRVGYSSSVYAMFNLCKEIRRKSLPELVELLSTRLDNDEFTLDGIRRRDRYGLPDFRLNQFSRRYIHHMLARLATYVETGSGETDRFTEYTDRNRKNAYDIEHIWSWEDVAQAEFTSLSDFSHARDHISGLLLLPADVNRSLQAKPYEGKVPSYAKQNLYAASLTPAAYQHQPQFSAFCIKSGLPFRSFEHFGRAEQEQRRELVDALVRRVWSTDRLREMVE